MAKRINLIERILRKKTPRRGRKRIRAYNPLDSILKTEKSSRESGHFLNHVNQSIDEWAATAWNILRIGFAAIIVLAFVAALF